MQALHALVEEVVVPRLVAQICVSGQTKVIAAPGTSGLQQNTRGVEAEKKGDRGKTEQKSTRRSGPQSCLSSHVISLAFTSLFSTL